MTILDHKQLEKDDKKYTYSDKLFGNILVVGRTNSCKTTLIQQWDKNGTITAEKVYWITPQPLDEKTELKITNSYQAEVVFLAAQDKESLSSLLTELKNLAHTSDNEEEEQFDDNEEEGDDYESDDEVDMEEMVTNRIDDSFGEKSNYRDLIVFDDMTSIADSNKDFVHFITVARKYKYSCVFVFHCCNTAKDNWQTILANTPVMVLFNTGYVQPGLTNVLAQNSTEGQSSSSKYVSRNKTWLSKVYKDNVYSHDGKHLLIDNRPGIPPGLARYRSDSGNKNNQLCFFVDEGNPSRYVKYMAEGINSHLFLVKKVVATSQSGERIRLNAGKSLEKLKKIEDSRKRKYEDYQKEDVEHTSINKRRRNIPKYLR